jgi:hypothetical protein
MVCEKRTERKKGEDEEQEGGKEKKIRREFFETINTESSVTIIEEGLAPRLASPVGADTAKIPADKDKVANTIVTKLIIPWCTHLASCEPLRKT